MNAEPPTARFQMEHQPRRPGYARRYPIEILTSTPMATVESNPTEEQLRETLVRSIKRFSLSYEQHQLIHSSSFGLLVSHIKAKRKFFTIVLGVLAAFFTVQAVRGLIASTSYIPWLFCSIACALWAFRRYSKVNSLAAAYDAYVAVAGEPEQEPHSLANELKLAFDLDYDEHQSIRSGNAERAAHGIIARRKANTRSFAIGAAILSAIAILVWGLFGIGFAILLCLGAVASFARDRAVIANVQKLLARYSTETQDG
ncbi:hypothetical protein SH528x_002122 [Novipirellula sp. SH528]|uniref:hypothetical protein n=1 Tax=Novipirellula sp. SH528 TaxID=3454466 RepID=UPI003FA15E42